MLFRARILASIVGAITGTPDVGASRYDYDDSEDLVLSLGTGAGQANAVVTDRFTIAASGTLELDLTGGGLTDALGRPVNFTAIKAIKLKADRTNANNLVVGGAVANAFVGPFADATDKIALKPGAFALLAEPGADGWTVTAGTGDKLLLANSGAGTGVTGTITLIGEAA